MSKRLLQAILFDKDGTLLDFRATWTPAYKGAASELAARLGGGDALAARLLARLGYDVAADSFAPDSVLLWDTNDGIAACLAAAPEIEERLDTREVVFRHFGDSDRYPPRPVGDLQALMARLRARGLRLGVATMDTTAVALDHLTRLGVIEALDFVTGADAGHGEKPGPGMALAFCESLGLDPAAVMVVGDMPVDLVMARRAGCALAVGVETSMAPLEQLRPLADYMLPSVQEVEALLEDGSVRPDAPARAT